MRRPPNEPPNRGVGWRFIIFLIGGMVLIHYLNKPVVSDESVQNAHDRGRRQGHAIADAMGRALSSPITWLILGVVFLWWSGLPKRPVFQRQWDRMVYGTICLVIGVLIVVF